MLSKDLTNVNCIPYNIISKKGVFDKDKCVEAIKRNDSYFRIPLDLIDEEIASACFRKYQLIKLENHQDSLLITLEYPEEDSINKIISLYMLDDFNGSQRFKRSSVNIRWGQFILDNCVYPKCNRIIKDKVFMQNKKVVKMHIDYELYNFVPESLKNNMLVNSKVTYLNGLTVPIIRKMEEILLPGPILVFDLHNLNRKQSEELLDNIINSIQQNHNSALLVHGYHHGKIIKDLIKKKASEHANLTSHRISYNEGRTLIQYDRNKYSS